MTDFEFATVALNGMLIFLTGGALMMQGRSLSKTSVSIDRLDQQIRAQVNANTQQALAARATLLITELSLLDASRGVDEQKRIGEIRAAIADANRRLADLSRSLTPDAEGGIG